jgi:ubiquinone biosynthesis monooxygenase Coq7
MMAPMSASHPLDLLDRAIVGLDRALRTVAGVHTAHRASPAEAVPEADLDAGQREHAAALMRVNHAAKSARRRSIRARR